MEKEPKIEKEEKKEEFESKLLDLARVSHTRAGGRRLRFRAVIVTGNKAGKVGVGVASGLDVAQAVEKATYQSKKNMIEVPIVEDTIPHEVYAKCGAAEVLLRPQRKGRGLVAGGTVRIICTLAGIKNISSKVLGRTGNKINNALATIWALKKLKQK
jgi:small subunit ribosomal protein S5